jgi:hypothetical protein
MRFGVAAFRVPYARLGILYVRVYMSHKKNPRLKAIGQQSGKFLIINAGQTDGGTVPDCGIKKKIEERKKNLKEERDRTGMEIERNKA